MVKTMVGGWEDVGGRRQHACPALLQLHLSVEPSLFTLKLAVSSCSLPVRKFLSSEHPLSPPTSLTGHNNVDVSFTAVSEVSSEYIRIKSWREPF